MNRYRTPAAPMAPASQMAAYEAVYGPPPPSRGKKFAKRLGKLFALVLVAATLWFGFSLYQSIAKLTGESNPLNLFGSLSKSELKTTDGRTNILLAGYSADDPNHGGADLTDSIMVLSLDAKNDNAVMISIPRDLYVDIPGHGYAKINAAYEYGEWGKFSEAGYPAGGMGLLEKTVTQNFGIGFNYYALINYTAFRQTVDAVGGVTVTIKSTDPDGLYDPNANLRLPNGTVQLNGQQALDLARARGAGYGSYGLGRGDFDRTANQQLILRALKDKISSTSTITNPLKVVELANALGDNVKTDLTLGEMQTLYSEGAGLKDSSITSLTLNNYNGENLLRSYRTRDGQSALVPAAGVDDYSRIRSVITVLFGDQTDPANGTN